jgi:hypothetical protein
MPQRSELSALTRFRLKSRAEAAVGDFEVGDVRVKSHAQKGGAVVDAFFQKSEEGFHAGVLKIKVGFAPDLFDK